MRFPAHILSHSPALAAHVHCPYIQYFGLEENLNGPPDLNLIGLPVYLKGNLVHLPFLQVGFFRDVRLLDHLIDIHYEPNASCILSTAIRSRKRVSYFRMS